MSKPTPDPLSQLNEQDRNLIVEFVLCSGSLKALAESFGVSYPTIRARLDGLIARLRAVVDGQPEDPVARLLGDLVERGELRPHTARQIRDAVRENHQS